MQAVLSMLLVQVIGTGMQLLSKVILDNGTSVFALMAYRHVVAAISVVPFALFYERDVLKKLKLSWYLCFLFLANATTGITLSMGLYYYGLRDTSATYATSFVNLIPVVTFVLSVIVGMESLELGSKAGNIKIAGAILCVAGTLTSIAYEGKSFHIDARHHTMQEDASKNSHKYRGTVMLLASCLSYAIWYILQVKLVNVFASKYWATMLTCIIASTQSAIFGLCLETSKESWKLGWNLQLITILYSGCLSTAATLCLISWVVLKRGPTYPPMFNPLMLILVALLEALLLGQPIHLGMLLGMGMIVAGLYFYLWGKRKESEISFLQAGP